MASTSSPIGHNLTSNSNHIKTTKTPHLTLLSHMYNQHFFDKGLGLEAEDKHKVNRLVMALSNYGLGVCCGEPRFLGEGDLDECLFGPVATCLRITLNAAHLHCYVMHACNLSLPKPLATEPRNLRC